MNKSAIELAMEIEKGDVDLETLNYVQQKLMSTINDTLEIKDKREKAADAAKDDLAKVDIQAIENAEKLAVSELMKSN